MAPLASVLAAAEARLAQLQEEFARHREELQGLDAEIAAKREEKTIAARGEVSALLKKKEACQKDAKALTGACSIVEKAVAKVQRTADLGLEDWASVHEEKIKISDFAKGRLQENLDVLVGLKKACGGGLTFKDGVLTFAGSKEAIPKLQAALSALESDFEAWVESDDETSMRLAEARGELKRLAKKHDVTVERDGKSKWIRVAGPQQAAEKAVKTLKSVLEGKQDLDCPKNLIRDAKALIDDVEPETGCMAEVLSKGGWGGGGKICIRGDPQSVREATDKVREWLDEKEGATSVFRDLNKEISGWVGLDENQFWSDIGQMASNFGVCSKDPGDGQLELRGAPDAVKAAEKELQQILSFYKEKCKGNEKQAKKQAKAQEPAPDEDDWGAAPAAEPAPCAW